MTEDLHPTPTLKEGGKGGLGDKKGENFKPQTLKENGRDSQSWLRAVLCLVTLSPLFRECSFPGIKKFFFLKSSLTFPSVAFS